jgi:hypothetical protein
LVLINLFSYIDRRVLAAVISQQGTSSALAAQVWGDADRGHELVSTPAGLQA